MDRGAWRATVLGTAKSRTRLKQLSTHTRSIRWASLVAQIVKKESARSARDLGLIPWSGRSPEEGDGNPLQYSCLETE